MKFNDTDQFAVNRDGVTYRVSFDDLASDIELKLNLDDYVPGDGKLTINNSDGSKAGEFSANQTGDVTISLPAEFSGNYNDLTNLPVIGDGTITITEHNGTEVGQFTVNQEGDVTIKLPEIDIPEALHPKGFIDVEDPAPVDPEHGDIYIQHHDGNDDVTADESFAPGITGTVDEGVFVIYGNDDEWHAGGQSAPTQMQSDYDEIDTGSPAFIKNKPDLPGDGKLTINNHDGTLAGDFTANQTGDVTITLPTPPALNWDDIEGKPEIPTGPLECPVHQVEFVEGWDDDTNVNEIDSFYFEEYDEFYRLPYNSSFQRVKSIVKLRTGPDAEWNETEITGWRRFTSPDLNGEYLDFQVEEANSNWNEAQPETCGPIKDGRLVVVDSRARPVAMFSANQVEDVAIKVPSTTSIMEGCDAPHTMNYLHIKNVRGGKLKIQNHDSLFVSLEVLHVGNDYAYSNFLREKKRYGSALMVFGNENTGIFEDDGGYPGKPKRALMYGDATFAGQPFEYEGGDDINYDAGRSIIIQQGQNPDNWFGTGDRHSEHWGSHGSSCHILPTCLMKNAAGEDVEVPNTFEYLIYFTGDIQDNPASFLQGEEGCTYDLGPLTHTVNAKYLNRFFYRGTVPHVGLRYMQTPKCERFFETFYECKNLGFAPELYFWDTSSGKDFTRMFHREKNFDANVGSWDMRKAETTKQMFEQCTNFTCNGKSRAGEGLDNWQLLSLGKNDTNDYRGAGGETFHMCYELAHDMSSVRVPNVTSMDSQNTPLYQFNDHTRVDFDNGGTVRGDESSTAANLQGPWNTTVARYVYVQSNRFTRDPLWGPDRKENVDGKNIVVNKGWTPEFIVERRKIWQEYIEWSDQTVEDGTRDRYQDETGGFHEKYDELKERDDLLCEQYFDPTWGDVKMKSNKSPYRIYDEGSPLADPVEPARAWSENGTTFKIKVEWTKEYFSGKNYKNEWVSSNTDYEWNIISGGDLVSLDSMTSRTPAITFSGDTDDEAVLEIVLTQKDDPTVTESFQLIIIGAESDPSA